MSDVLDRRRATAKRQAAARAQPAASVWVRGMFAATWAVAVGVASLIVLALVVWAADSQSTASAGGAMRFAVQIWLLAHRTPLRVDGGALTIPPIGLTIVLGLLLVRATAILARSAICEDGRDVGIIIAAVTLPYAGLAAGLAAISQSSSLHPSIGAAFLCAAVIGGLSATIGAFRGAGVTRATVAALRVDLRVALEAAGAAASVVFAAAMVVTIGSLFAHSRQFGTMLSSYHGASGEFSMILFSVLLLPTAGCFAVGYLVGPGFAVGSGTSVAYGGAHLAAVPAMPLLSAVPSGPAPWQIVVVCIGAVVLASATGAWRIARTSTLTLTEQLRSVLIAAVVLGVGVAALVGFAGGPAGPGRLRTVGPSPWQVGLTLAGEMAVVSVIVVLAAAWSAQARTMLSRNR